MVHVLQYPKKIRKMLLGANGECMFHVQKAWVYVCIKVNRVYVSHVLQDIQYSVWGC